MGPCPSRQPRALGKQSPVAILSRYSRQMLLPGIGEAGQRRLLASHAAIVGVGALGCASADTLARAGVGRITLIDRDIVEETNLQRQCLFTEADARQGLPKADAAAARLAAVNSSIEIRPVVADLTARNIAGVLGAADVIIDGTDNFATRFLVNDFAVSRAVPWVYAGAIGSSAAILSVLPGRSACLRCVFEDLPEPGTGGTCDTVGVLGPAIGLVAALQSAEAMKMLLGLHEVVHGGLRAFDVWGNTSRTVNAVRRAECPCCVLRRFEFLESLAAETAALCGRDAVQVVPGGGREARLDLESLAARLAPAGIVQSGPSFVRLRPHGDAIELTVFADARAIVRGTSEPSRARAAYAKYVGA